MKAKHSVNSLNFNWKQSLPVMMPESIRHQIKQVAEDFDSNYNWKRYESAALVDDSEHDLSLFDRGRRALCLREIPAIESECFSWIEQNILCFLDYQRIRVNTVQIPSLIAIIYQSDAKSIGVQPHTDSACPESGWRQLRFNFMIQNAEHGGNPVIHDEILEVPDGAGWYLFATDQNHRALPAKGKTMRIILSMAYFIDPGYIPTAKQILTTLE